MAKCKKFTSPSYLQASPYGYHFRYKIPPDIRPVIGRTELKCSLRTGKLSKAKVRSRILSSLTHLVISDIRRGGMMSELSQSEIQNLLREYFDKTLSDDESWRVNRKPHDDDQLDSQLAAYVSLRFDAQEELAKSDCHNVTEQVDDLIADHGLIVNRDSETYKKLCREMLKVNIKIPEIAERRKKGTMSLREPIIRIHQQTVDGGSR